MGLEIPEKYNSDLKKFYSDNIFHERQMNSCPIGCDGCAVSAQTSTKGSVKFQDLIDFYQDAYNKGVSLKITKVEGYDPAFVSYADNDKIPFAQSIVSAVNMGHQIITPICTTGSWKSEKTLWQLDELGKLSNKYRRFTYPSGNSGEAFVLSVPREIRPFSNGKYDFETHVNKIAKDIELLTQNGNVDVLIYYNSNTEGDMQIAEGIRDKVAAKLNETQKERANLLIENFNSDTLPESCMRYPNSYLLSDQGFAEIDPVTLNWEHDSKTLEAV